MTDLVERLRAALDETEAWALAASQTATPGTATGEHWRWECSHCDTAITINPVTDACVECPNDCSAGVSLRSVEQYPTSSSYTLPAFIVDSEEVPATAGALIVRHDPASVLRMVAAHRKILDLHADSDFPPDPDEVTSDYSWQDYCNGCGGAFRWPCPTLRALAEAYGVEA